MSKQITSMTLATSLPMNAENIAKLSQVAEIMNETAARLGDLGVKAKVNSSTFAPRKPKGEAA